MTDPQADDTPPEVDDSIEATIVPGARESDPPGTGGGTTATLMNLLEAWEGEVASDPTVPLSTIRIGQDESHVIPFTTSGARVVLHYLDVEELRGYVHCNGQDCLLCRIGRQSDRRTLLPVYDPLERVVAVLPIPPSLRPSALQPQLHPILRRVAGGEGVLVSIRKTGNYEYHVHARALPEGVDRGDRVIGRFKTDVDAGRVDLTSAYPRRSGEELAGIEGIRRVMELKRIDP